jgi:putative membrane protein
MKHLVVMFKGMAFGLSNLVPGLTGGAILIMLGVYEEFVDALGNFFINRSRRKAYLLFLGSLGLGAGIAILLFARLMTWLLAQQPALMMFFFKGLLLGTIPSLSSLHDDLRFTPRRGVAALGGLALVVLVKAVGQQGSHAALMTESGSLVSFVYAFATGFFAGGANVMPGISGAYIMLLAGMYGPIMEAISALSRLVIHWEVLVPSAMGIALGLVGFSKMIDLALKRAPAISCYIILGLLIGSVYGLWHIDSLNAHPLALALCLALGIAIPLAISRRSSRTALVVRPAPSAGKRADL